MGKPDYDEHLSGKSVPSAMLCAIKTILAPKHQELAQRRAVNGGRKRKAF